MNAWRVEKGTEGGVRRFDAPQDKDARDAVLDIVLCQVHVRLEVGEANLGLFKIIIYEGGKSNR